MASELAELLVRGGIDSPVVLVGASSGGLNVRVFASDHPKHVAGLVAPTPPTKTRYIGFPRLARFVPLLSTIGVFRVARRVVWPVNGGTARPPCNSSHVIKVLRTSGYQAAADEIMHIRESASEVSTLRRRLTIPVLVVTGGGEADENGQQLQRDQASLSERGCLIVAENSGHVVAIDQPEVVVEAIRAVVG